jgi:hypothetical protein
VEWQKGHVKYLKRSNRSRSPLYALVASASCSRHHTGV